jgi:hypothetical protein
MPKIPRTAWLYGLWRDAFREMLRRLPFVMRYNIDCKNMTKVKIFRNKQKYLEKVLAVWRN